MSGRFYIALATCICVSLLPTFSDAAGRKYEDMSTKQAIHTVFGKEISYFLDETNSRNPWYNTGKRLLCILAPKHGETLKNHFGDNGRNILDHFSRL